jgi:hypothetical protein
MSQKRILFKKVIKHQRPIELIGMHCIKIYSDIGCEDVMWIKVA